MPTTDGSKAKTNYQNNHHSENIMNFIYDWLNDLTMKQTIFSFAHRLTGLIASVAPHTPPAK